MSAAAQLLLVCDGPNLRAALEFMLEREGYRLSVADDAEQALALAVAQTPDLILLDLMPPARSAFDLCQQIRSLAALAAVPVIMLSERARDTDVAKGLAVGADRYLTKPFVMSDLLGQVRELLAARAGRGAADG